MNRCAEWQDCQTQRQSTVVTPASSSLSRGPILVEALKRWALDLITIVNQLGNGRRLTKQRDHTTFFCRATCHQNVDSFESNLIAKIDALQLDSR